MSKLKRLNPFLPRWHAERLPQKTPSAVLAAPSAADPSLRRSFAAATSSVVCNSSSPFPKIDPSSSTGKDFPSSLMISPGGP
ncbi:hypothetical protein L6452_21007 [Arctium lappa]|uniref:Uncharacterized protein n=1 Tax=Arctium lappa TaxID=4217 RepID=A0ACB9BC55_ARCLA|nr:hypothetical protein L6452_21007 [Arctium lappa]